MAWFNNLRLRSRDPEIRRKAIESMDWEGANGSDIEILAGFLADEAAEVRAEAVRALGTTNDQKIPDLLLPILRDANPEVRRNAAIVLGEAGATNSIPELVCALGDPEVGVRSGAAASLRLLGWRPNSDEERARFDIALGNVRGVGLMGQTAVNVLVSELHQDTSFARRSAAEALEGVADSRRIAPLLKTLMDQDPTVRVSAIHALKGQTEPEVRNALLRRLSDKEACVRLAAAQVLSVSDDPELVAHFFPGLEDENFEIRLTAVQFVGRFRCAEIVEALVRRLSDVDADVRLAAARALGAIADPAAIEGLVMALIDEERMVRQAAEISLGQIDPAWEYSAMAQGARAKLEETLRQRPAWVQGNATQMLARLNAAGQAGLPAADCGQEEQALPGTNPGQ